MRSGPSTSTELWPLRASAAGLRPKLSPLVSSSGLGRESPKIKGPDTDPK